MTPMNLMFRAFNGPKDWAWVREHVMIKRVEDTSGVVAYDLDKKEMVAAFICEKWTLGSVIGHYVVVNPRVLMCGFIEECADFIFNVCGRVSVISHTPGNNTRALRLNRRMGGTVKARLKDAFAPGVDMVITEFRAENFKYLPKKDQKYG